MVDDHPANLLALEAILAGTAYELVRAQSGAEALKALLHQEFAIILMDVAMPEMDGYETAELIRRRESSRYTPIIFITANIKSDTHIVRGYSVGAVDYLFKPFVPEVLLWKVAVFVDLYTKRQIVSDSTEALKRAYDDMEHRVEERTSELAATNHSLEAEVAERQCIELQRTQGLEREHRGLLEAEAMNRLKDEFLSTLSHELRTPLNAILGWADILQKGAEDPVRIARGLRVIKKNAEAQARLIDDMMDVSSIMGGRLTLKLGLVSLRSVIEAALDAAEPAVGAKCITVERDLEDLAPIVADRDRLQQVLWNLLSNAVKFTPKDGRIRVELRAQEGDIVLTVTDSGQGIDPAFLPHVFDRFAQADGSVTRVHWGLGLGMAIVRHLVELHGGLVTAASDGKDQGATFAVTLPLGATPGVDSKPDPSSPARPAIDPAAAAPSATIRKTRRAKTLTGDRL